MMCDRTHEDSAETYKTDGERNLRRLAFEVLRSAIHQRRNSFKPGIAPAPRSQVERLLREMCTVGRDRGLEAEQVLIVLKDAWRNLPDVELIDRSDSNAMLSSVITRLIKEYYDSAASPHN